MSSTFWRNKIKTKTMNINKTLLFNTENCHWTRSKMALHIVQQEEKMGGSNATNVGNNLGSGKWKFDYCCQHADIKGAITPLHSSL